MFKPSQCVDIHFTLQTKKLSFESTKSKYIEIMIWRRKIVSISPPLKPQYNDTFSDVSNWFICVAKRIKVKENLMIFENGNVQTIYFKGIEQHEIIN